MRWQVMPVLRRVVVSEERAHELNNKLRRNEARIRAILDRVDEGILSMTIDGVVRTLNPAAERMFDYRAEEIIGQDIALLMPEPYRTQYEDFLKNYLETGQQNVIGNRREIVGRRRDGTTFPVEMSVGEVKFSGEHLFICAMRDIAERKANEARVVHLANHDSLTNLPNRNLLQDRALHPSCKPVACNNAWVSCLSISITSKPSTTRSATMLVTACCKPWPYAFAVVCAMRIR